MNVLYDMIRDVLDYAESELDIVECNLERAEKEIVEDGDVDHACSIEDQADAIGRVIKHLEKALYELE